MFRGWLAEKVPNHTGHAVRWSPDNLPPGNPPDWGDECWAVDLAGNMDITHRWWQEVSASGETQLLCHFPDH